MFTVSYTVQHGWNNLWTSSLMYAGRAMITPPEYYKLQHNIQENLISHHPSAEAVVILMCFDKNP